MLYDPHLPLWYEGESRDARSEQLANKESGAEGTLGVAVTRGIGSWVEDPAILGAPHSGSPSCRLEYLPHLSPTAF
jgi:hypothetical protein